MKRAFDQENEILGKKVKKRKPKFSVCSFHLNVDSIIPRLQKVFSSKLYNLFRKLVLSSQPIPWSFPQMLLES